MHYAAIAENAPFRLWLLQQEEERLSFFAVCTVDPASEDLLG
jgi:hypothetical protein